MGRRRHNKAAAHLKSFLVRVNKQVSPLWWGAVYAIRHRRLCFSLETVQDQGR